MTLYTDTHCTASTPNTGKISLLSMIRLSLAARRQRVALRKLDETTLNDLGLTRTQRDIEAARPLWDVPQNWLR